jgi:hypothetical protein
MPLRALVIPAVALLVGVVACGLTFWQFGSVPGALLAAGAAFGASLKLLHDLIE